MSSSIPKSIPQNPVIAIRPRTRQRSIELVARLTLIALLISCAAAASQAQTTLDVSVSNPTPVAGETLTAFLSINLTQPTVGGAFTINYNTAVLQLTGSTISGALPGDPDFSCPGSIAIACQPNPGPGQIFASFGNKNGISGAYTFATLDFLVLSDSPTTVAMSVTSPFSDLQGGAMTVIETPAGINSGIAVPAFGYPGRAGLVLLLLAIALWAAPRFSPKLAGSPPTQLLIVLIIMGSGLLAADIARAHLLDDFDSDGVHDPLDNCITIANPNQYDSNQDGYGNACDADLNGDLMVDAADLALLKTFFFGTNADGDLNADGTVDFLDLGKLKSLDLQPPGPKCIDCPIPQFCGDGIVQIGEQCDDGNNLDGDGCESDCTIISCGTPSYNSTFEAIQAVIFDSYGCSNAVCHGFTPGSGNLDLRAPNAYADLVGVASSGSTMKRVEPGDESISYLYDKLAAATIPGWTTTGTPMPAGGFPPLTADHLEAVRLWIHGGAPETLVVDGTAALLASCLPDPDPLKIPEPPAPGAGVGVQLQSTAWPLAQQSEDEVCLATYYDFTQTSLIPLNEQVDCLGLADGNNPSGKCFRYHKQVLAQDPMSHHSIIYFYTGDTDVLDATDPVRQFGPFTYKPNDLADPNLGLPCDPKVIDPATGRHANCSGVVVSGSGCSDFGPPDYLNSINSERFSGAQQPFTEQTFASGVYALMPMSGVVVWNSHAFNLTSTDSNMAQYLNLELAGPNDQSFPVQSLFDASSVFDISVPPFQTDEVCGTSTLPIGARLFELSSHMHKRGVLWRAWSPPNTPCNPGEPACVPGPEPRLVYLSTEYSDPLQLEFHPPVVLDSAAVEDRTYLFCAVYDNGSTPTSPPVKQQSTSVVPPLFGAPGGPCGGSTVACMAGPNKAALCAGVDSVCDSTPGAGDGICDACPVLGGVTSDDEMFLPLGLYYENFGAPASPDVDPSNVNSLIQAWDIPLPGGVSSSPVVDGNSVYVTSWDGKVYAYDRTTGASLWASPYDTTSGGVQGTVTLTGSGTMVVGDGDTHVHLIDTATGVGIWEVTLGNPAVDHIWGTATISNGRIFIGVASNSDVPCTNGRLVSLSLADGSTNWTRVNVPAGVCDNDTNIECTLSSECGTGTCVAGVGAGVTATPVVDATGAYVYYGTVGCYTFPSIGDSDSIIKLDAATGATVWVTRVDPPEQFGFCDNAPTTECGVDADCGAGTCITKPFYHDFGFLNGPILIDISDGGSGTKTVAVAGSKNGTLYALEVADGAIAWSNEVLPSPVSPDFAGFGLFNGAVSHEAGRIHAGLYEFSPATVPAPDHLQAFNADDGSVLWTDDIGPTWGTTNTVNGVVFIGSSQIAEFYAYDAATGALLNTFTLPNTTASKPSVDGGMVFIGYGIFGGPSGVRAYTLP